MIRCDAQAHHFTLLCVCVCVCVCAILLFILFVVVFGNNSDTSFSLDRAHRNIDAVSHRMRVHSSLCMTKRTTYLCSRKQVASSLFRDVQIPRDSVAIVARHKVRVLRHYAVQASRQCIGRHWWCGWRISPRCALVLRLVQASEGIIGALFFSAFSFARDHDSVRGIQRRRRHAAVDPIGVTVRLHMRRRDWRQFHALAPPSDRNFRRTQLLRGRDVTRNAACCARSLTTRTLSKEQQQRTNSMREEELPTVKKVYEPRGKK